MEYGLIGEKLSHSFSPLIHSMIGNYDYELCEIQKSDIETFLNKKDFKGINVTIPYKQTVIPFLDYIDPPAEKIGAVNTAVNRGGKLYGYNTDYYGLKALVIKCCGNISLKDKDAMVFGTGGTSKTAFNVLKDLGCRNVYILSRKPSGSQIGYNEAPVTAKDAVIAVNTTPAGMFPNTDGCATDISLFKNLKVAVDAVYNPLRTDLVLNSQKLGLSSKGGLYMLVSQAVMASHYFFDKDYNDGLAADIYSTILNRLQNIVLTGMPACGKSTIGKVLAAKAGKDFIDTDELIVEKTGKSINEIFADEGENGFRKIESEIIAEVSLKNNCVIATGGGAVLNKDNVRRLAHNGVICFLDRPIEQLLPTDDRPLANSAESIKKRYNERIGIYNTTCDFSVPVISPDVTADSIIKIYENNI